MHPALQVASIGAQVAQLSGTYRAELLIGDAYISNAVAWHFADVELSFGKAAAAAAAAEPVLAARKEILHQFRKADEGAGASTALLASAVVLAPWLVLVVGVRVSFLTHVCLCACTCVLV